MRMFFDHQVNGFAGVDFQQPDLSAAQLGAALRALRERQTRILLTLITDRIDALCARLERLEALAREQPDADVIAGYHLEGPYLSPLPGYHGAHPPELMKAPRIDEFERLWSAANGRIRLITLAPEWPGSEEFIRHVVGRGVRVAIGHSAADDATLDAAIAAGLTLCTHLGNAVPTELPRHDNIIQRLLARDELYASFIPDGIHLPPHILKNFVRAKPPDRVIFTTDAMAAAGAGPGSYRLGRLRVVVGDDGIVREPGQPNFAGSSLTMDAAFANVQRFLGLSAAEAMAACSSRALTALGLPADS